MTGATRNAIKARIDFAALVSEHVALKRSGRAFVGLCPFHQEKTPSFRIDPQRGTFRCFGCNAGGDAFTFVMRARGATFPEAVHACAELAGVKLRRAGGNALRTAQRRRDATGRTNGATDAEYTAV